MPRHRAAPITARRGALAVGLVAALVAVAGVHARGVGATAAVISDSHPAWLVTLLVLAAAGPIVHGRLLCAGQATVGAQFKRWEAIRVAAGIHAANLTLKTAGASGLAVLLLGHPDASVGHADRSAAYVLGREVAHLALAGVVLLAIALVAVDGHTSALVVDGAGLFFLSRVGHVAVLWLAATHPRCLPRWGLLDRLRTQAPSFAEALRRAVTRPGLLIRIGVWALALDILRIAWLSAALHAVSAPASIDATVENYGIVALLSTVSVLPAGLVAVDAGLVTALHHSGTPLAPATAAVLLFRVAELWIPLLAGARPALAAARPRGRHAVRPAA